MNSLCPQKERCGSCGWSHIPYEKQLAQKLSDINGSFRLKNLDLSCTEIIPAPHTDHYRNRMDFVIDFEGHIGLREKGKWWRVIDNHTCFIADERIEVLFQRVREWLQTAGLSYYDRKSHQGLLRYAVIRATSIGETMITIITSAPHPQEELATREALNHLYTHAQPTTLVWSINHTITDVSMGDELITIAGTGAIEEQVNGFHYRITPHAFFQTNSSAAALLQSTVSNYAGDLQGKTLVDLYCGSGFFSVPLAQNAQRTIGIELSSEAIEEARNNAATNGVRAEYIDAATEKKDWEAYSPDVVIVDPPRSGMHDHAFRDLLRILPSRVIYISCNYKNFAREMVELQQHYHPEQMNAIDLFPHTPHVELVTLLMRR